MDRFLPIPCQSPAASEPGKGPFDDPAAWQDHKALGRVGALDDLERPLALAHERGLQFLTRISAVGEKVAQPREAITDRTAFGGLHALAVDHAGGRRRFPTSRISLVRGRPPDLAGGMNGSMIDHSRSVKSLG